MLRVVVVALAALFAAGSALAQDDLVATPAKFAVIMDYETGAVLFEKNADEPTPPASMSKLMTSAIVFDRIKSGQLKPTDEFVVSENAWREKEGSSMWVRVDTRIKVIDLLRGIIIQSGNDACIVVAENIAGSEEAFADLMTKKAREWGLNNSTFGNAHGKPHPKQLMSMRDIALLSRRIIKEYPDYFKIYSERDFTWEGIKQPNRNPLLGSFPGADGLKTGHTEEAGYGLAGTAVQDGVRRIVVFHGMASEKDRSVEAQRLMRIAFNDFTNRVLYDEGDIVGDALVFKGADKTTPLVVKEKISAILHRSVADAVKATVIYEGPVRAPIAEGQEIGYLRIETPSGDRREYPLYAGKAVREIGPFGKIALAAKTLLLPKRAPSTEPAPEGAQ
ncbi:MAG: D-alanyl-D-alanine carboxypeptidase [Parvularculaceae bacterium]|nr:D-alanyl-D-alanine carboxypeptidase [Parvularculaceae bacterium]